MRLSFAHAARAQRAGDLVGPEASATGQCHTGLDYTPGELESRFVAATSRGRMSNAATAERYLK